MTCDVGFYGFILGITQTWSPLKTSEDELMDLLMDLLLPETSWYDVDLTKSTAILYKYLTPRIMLMMPYMLEVSIHK